MNIKRLSEYAIIPSSGSEYSAGYDLYFAAPPEEEITIWAHETKILPTGWAMEIPIGYFGAIFARSGLASKQGLRPANCVGVVDSDYRGEVKVALHNDTNEPKIIHGQERIAQFTLLRYYSIPFEETEELEDTARGTGGFGSTGQ